MSKPTVFTLALLILLGALTLSPMLDLEAHGISTSPSNPISRAQYP